MTINDVQQSVRDALNAPAFTSALAGTIERAVRAGLSNAAPSALATAARPAPARCSTADAHAEQLRLGGLTKAADAAQRDADQTASILAKMQAGPSVLRVSAPTGDGGLAKAHAALDAALRMGDPGRIAMARRDVEAAAFAHRLTQPLRYRP